MKLKQARRYASDADASKSLSPRAYSICEKKPKCCHPESPLGVRDPHLPSPLPLRVPHAPYLRVGLLNFPLPLPFPQSEISNLKFEISVAFVVGFISLATDIPAHNELRE